MLLNCCSDDIPVATVVIVVDDEVSAVAAVDDDVPAAISRCRCVAEVSAVVAGVHDDDVSL